MYRFGTWYPMEEAPKDGSDIFVCDEWNEGPYIVFWNKDCWWHTAAGSIDSDLWAWMPLPEAAKGKVLKHAVD